VFIRPHRPSRDCESQSRQGHRIWELELLNQQEAEQETKSNKKKGGSGSKILKSKNQVKWWGRIISLNFNVNKPQHSKRLRFRKYQHRSRTWGQQVSGLDSSESE
jgi:hypothetical protein